MRYGEGVRDRFFDHEPHERHEPAQSKPLLFGSVGGEFDMRIGENLGVHRHEWNIQNACRGNDELIGGITVKSPGELCGLDTNSWRKIDEMNARI